MGCHNKHTVQCSTVNYIGNPKQFDVKNGKRKNKYRKMKACVVAAVTLVALCSTGTGLVGVISRNCVRCDVLERGRSEAIEKR